MNCGASSKSLLNYIMSPKFRQIPLEYSKATILF